MKLTVSNRRVRTVFVAVAMWAAGTAHAQQPAPSAGEQMQAEGQRLYQMHCSYCHGAGPGRAGTAALARRLGKERSLLENRDDLQPPYVQHVVRFGMNAMIPFRRTEVSDAELRAITAWLIRPRGPEAAATTAVGSRP